MLRSALTALVALTSLFSGFLQTGTAHAGEFDFGIIITNKDYNKEQGVDVVDYAFNDGLEMRKAMRDVFMVPSLHILEHKNVTLAQFYSLFGRERAADGQIFSRFRDRSHRKARLIVYYAGHGVPRAPRDTDNTTRPYLLPIDGNPGSPENTGYALAELIERLKQIKAQILPEGQVILILESCFSGQSHRGAVALGTSGGAVPVQLLNPQTAEANDIIVLAASQGTETASWDTQRHFSVFTNVLIDGLYGWADERRYNGNEDKTITLKELHSFTMSQVNRRLDELKLGRRQQPAFSGNDSLVIASFTTALVRDPEQRSREERDCSRLKATGTTQQIRDFLAPGGCRYCMCRDELQAKISAIQIGQAACTDDRKLRERLVLEGNLEQLTWLATNTQCEQLKTEIAPDVANLTRICTEERTKAERLRDAGALRDFAKKTVCLATRTSAAELADRLEANCSSSRPQWEELKATGAPADLRLYASRTSCPEFKESATRLAEQRETACRTENTHFTVMATNPNMGVRVNALKRLAERAVCPEVKEKAQRSLDNLARSQEERCTSEEGKWAAFSARADHVALTKARTEFECPRIVAEIDAAMEKVKPTVVSGKPIQDCPTCPRIIAIKAACYVVGADASDNIAEDNERSPHSVRIQSFALGVTEVTVGEWAACHAKGACTLAPPAGADPKMPMMGVSAEDARAYVGWLARETGQRYRLPTEAEWEYAARSGTRVRYAFGDRPDTSKGRFSPRNQIAKSAATVGSYAANEFGLFDMSGNAAEIVADCYEGSHAGRPKEGVARTSCTVPGRIVVRGGSWTSVPLKVRTTSREGVEARMRREDVGFRVARDAPELAATMPTPASCP